MLSPTKLSIRVVIVKKLTNMAREWCPWPTPQNPVANAHSSVAEGSGLFSFPKKKITLSILGILSA